MRKLTYLVLLSVVVSGSPAFAAGYFRLNALYLSEETQQSSSSKTTRTLLDLGAGYTWPSGLTLGGLYGTEKRKSDSSSTDRTSYGPTIGYMQSGEGFFLLGTYFLMSDYEQLDGTGYEVDAGYRFKVSSVGVGLQIAYKHFEYNKSNGASFSPTIKQNYIDPYFAIWLEF